MQTIFTHIQSLFGIQNELLPSIKGHDLNKVEHLDQAWLLIEDDRILDFGSMEHIPRATTIRRSMLAVSLFFQLGAIRIHTWFFLKQEKRNL